MKTLLTSLALSLFTILQVNASLIPQDMEPYCDDIPFNTAEISIQTLGAEEVEKSIDDIPFNTAEIAFRTMVPLEEEEYVDDIPFSTEGIAFANKDCCFNMEDESYVDDIPFNTAEIAVRHFIPREIEWPIDELLVTLYEELAEIEIPSTFNNPLEGIQFLCYELEGMFSEIADVSEKVLFTDIEDHEEFILEIDRVVTKDMQAIFENPVWLKIF